MSTTVLTPEVAPALPSDIVTKISWKMPITYAVATIVTLVVAASTSGMTTFRFTLSRSDRFVIPDWHVNGATMNWILAGLTLLVFLYSLYRAVSRKPVGVVPAIVAGASVVAALLTWQGADAVGAVTLTATLASALALSTPLIFGSLSGVVAEHSGVVNISIEGQLLAGAFAGVLVASATGSVWLGLLAAPLAGVLMGALLALFAVKYNVDHIIVGVVLNTFALGLTTFFFSTVLSENPELNSSAVNLPNVKIPLLGDIPVIGPVLFNQTVLTYFMYVVIVVLTIYLFRSRWGLRLRACGEHPHAAATVGINVRRTRVNATLLSGALAGLGGSFFTIGASIGHSFNNNMSAGNGYIALAAMILGKWNPLGAVGAAVMFGFAKALAILMPSLNSNAPSNLINMIPYLVTVLAVAGFVGRSRPPASENVPYNN
ncbi:ABC transporter permease [Changpingibacter yushuensis]|uniref:ABC transporter permease n=1 Tax=Changpingibacter yushuensis TaxID=2758440 RepID=UPI0015F5D502|nr:ABC transporter permease [Changpingibacter yushuensis]